MLTAGLDDGGVGGGIGGELAVGFKLWDVTLSDRDEVTHRGLQATQVIRVVARAVLRIAQVEQPGVFIPTVIVAGTAGDEDAVVLGLAGDHAHIVEVVERSGQRPAAGQRCC